MERRTGTDRHRRHWLGGAAVVAVVVPALVLGTTSSQCSDAPAAAASACTSGPLYGAMTPLGGWVVLAAAATFVLYAVVRALRGR